MFTSIDDKPTELTITALVRARFCELAAQDRRELDTHELFTLGLFSVIDAFFDAPMEELIEQLPCVAYARDALIEHKGVEGELLSCLSALEAGDLGQAEAVVASAGQLYVAALRWADQISKPLFGP